MSGGLEDVEDGAALFDEISQTLRTYLRTTDPEHIDLITLWAAHTHFVPGGLETSARLFITSSMKGSGKTSALKWLRFLCRGYQSGSGMTVAGLVRTLKDGNCTILIDEADKVFRHKSEALTQLTRVVNEGYESMGEGSVMVQGSGGDWRKHTVSYFAPIAICGNNPDIEDDTMQRSIPVHFSPA